MKKKIIGTVAILSVTVITAVPVYIFLPERVAVQWSITGEAQNYLPKLAAVAAALGLGAFGAYYRHKKDRSSLEGAGKRLMEAADLFISCIGIIMLLLFLVLNL